MRTLSCIFSVCCVLACLHPTLAKDPCLVHDYGAHYSLTPQPADFLGESVAMTAKRAIVGGSTNGARPGSVMVYDFDGLSWSGTAQLYPPDGQSRDDFGEAVAISQRWIAVGAPQAEVNGTRVGAVYLFEQRNQEMTFHTKLTSPSAARNDHFGGALAIQDEFLVVGATQASPGYVNTYRFDGRQWNQGSTLHPAAGTSGYSFGRAVALDDNTMVVGQPSDDTVGRSSGSATVFQFDGDSWKRTQKLLASDASEYDVFGVSVSIDGNTLAIGAPNGDTRIGGDYHEGWVYVFDLLGQRWVERQKLLADDAFQLDQFGHAVAIEQDTLVIGRPGALFYNEAEGDVYVFRRTDGTWRQQHKLSHPSPTRDDHFGWSVCTFNDRAFVGAFGDDEAAGDGGSAFAYDLNCSPIRITIDRPCDLVGNVAGHWRGAAPGGRSLMIYGEHLGRSTIPEPFSQACADLTLDIAAPLRVEYWGPSGIMGSQSLNTHVLPRECNGFVQLVDLNACKLSEPVNIAR